MVCDNYQLYINLIFIHLLSNLLILKNNKMKHLPYILILIFLFISCNSSNRSEVQSNNNIHEVVVQEVLQVSEYTYVRALDEGVEVWLAVPATEVSVGNTYFYNKFMEMRDFESKELNKSFNKIYFLEGLSEKAEEINKALTTNTRGLNQEAIKPIIEKKEVSVEVVTDGITIATLFEEKDKYKDKIVKIKGKVVKYNPAIMGVNWIHIQDGTEFNGEFDLTVTSKDEVKVDEMITIEGTVVLDKDFGAGYIYDVIVENATVIKE